MSKIIIAVIVLVLLYLYMRRGENFSLAQGVGTRVVMYHYTDWCPACKAMRPRYEAAKAALSGSGIKFLEIDEVKTPTAGISSYPTIQVIDQYGKRHKSVGVLAVDDIIRFITTPNYHE